MQLRILSLALVAGLATVLTSSIAVADSGEVVDYESWDRLLGEYVDEDGQIDYRGWVDDEEDRRALSEFVDEIGEADARGHDRREVLAFLINAYNALVIEDVLERWPVENVTEEEGFFDGKSHRVLQASMTLDELDKEYIRDRYGEPRANFVLVCAAKSCPPLRTEPLTGQNLDEALEEATREYIPYATESVGQGRVETSRLFEWYGEEFEEAAGSVAGYLKKYVEDDELEEALGEEDVEVTFSDYDWVINAQ